jgi:hypothetical protein
MNGIDERPIVLSIAEAHILLMAAERLVQESREDEQQWQTEEGYEGPPLLAHPRTGVETSALDIARGLRERAMILCGSLSNPHLDGQISITWSEAQWYVDGLNWFRCYLEDEVMPVDSDDEIVDPTLRGLRAPINALDLRLTRLWNLDEDGWETTELDEFEF